jgi:hypothetical protein
VSDEREGDGRNRSTGRPEEGDPLPAPGPDRPG